MEGHVLISHKTPLQGNVFQPLLNRERFDPRDENSDCKVSPFRQQEDNEVWCLWDDL